MKEKWRQMLPAILIIGITIITSILLYDKMLDNEKEDCWKILEDSANSVAREIRLNSENSVNTLRLASDTISREWNKGADKVDISFLDKFQENTIFSRIEVLYPGNQTTLGLSFQETAAKGEFMSSRIDDPDTGKQYVCYCVPVKYDEVTVAVLVGVIETDYLQKTFKTSKS